jgi:hypothetical protein
MTAAEEKINEKMGDCEGEGNEYGYCCHRVEFEQAV